MSTQGSIRRTLIIYGVVACSGLAVTIVTLAGLFLSQTMVSEHRLLAADLRRVLEAHDELPVPYGTAALELAETSTAHPSAIRIDDDRGLVVSRGSGLAADNVRRGMRLLLLVSVGAAVMVGGLWGWLVSRVVLAPIRNLAASMPTVGPNTEGAGNEIQAVAIAFRRALRQSSEENRAQEKRSKEVASMQFQLARAERLASTGRLAAGVAHEIGNPLAAVMGYLKLLESGLEPAQESDVLVRASSELERIHGTLKGMLAFTRSDAEESPLQPVDVGALIHDTVALVRAHPAMARVSITVDAAEGPPVAGRPHGIVQILFNLLINAGQAGAGSPEPSVQIRARYVDGAATIEVSDNGPGVARTVRDSIFEPFVTTKQAGEGTGLGLAVSATLAQSMNGTLELISAPGTGATFRLRLSTLPGNVSVRA